MTIMSGVYAIVLNATKIAYVGQAKNIALRWRQHLRKWVWPNDAELVVVREMPDSTRSERQRTESALARLMRRRGYFLLSTTVEEHTKQTIPLALANRRPGALKEYYATSTPEQRRARTAAARSVCTPELLSDAGKKGGAASVKSYTPQERSIRMKQWSTGLSKEELTHRGRLGGAASGAIPNRGRFTSERFRGVPKSPEHREKIRQALLARRA